MHDLASEIVKEVSTIGVSKYEGLNESASFKKLEDKIRADLREICKESKVNIKQENYGYNNKTLMEYYYPHKAIDTKLASDIVEKANRCGLNLLECTTIKEIKSNRTNIELLENNDKGFSYTECNGVKVYTLVDLLYKDKNSNQYTLVDFKSGERNFNDEMQLAIYSMYVTKKYNVPIDKVSARIEYLRSGNVLELRFTQKDLQEAEIYINQGVSEIDGYLSDVNGNVPKDINAFQKTSSIYKCRGCRYQEICM